MDTKKPFASLLEDHTPGSGTATPSFDSLSLFQSGPLGGASSSSGSSSLLYNNNNNNNNNNNTSTTTNIYNYNHSQEKHGQSAAPVLSCVSKEMIPEDCAQQRFIVWAAVKRNESLRKIPEKKLECPLLKCDERFGDHESMLKHLANCTYLAEREYWCYDHMKVERFDDIKCRRCLGHVSKRRKVLSIAKGFFHKLGHKSKRDQGVDYHDDEQLMPPPPSYESIGPLLAANGSIITELPSTEILEADSVEVPMPQPQPLTITAPDGINPQNLLIPTPLLPELDSTMMPWDPIMPSINTQVLPNIPTTDAREQLFKPALQLHTHGLQPRRPSPRPVSRPVPAAPRSKGLSPSSSVRSNASTDSTVSTDSTTSTNSTMSNDSNISMSSNGSSLVSPISDYSGDWSMSSGVDTHKTSPVDKIMMDNPFGDQFGYNEACTGLDVYELPADFPISRPEDLLTAAPLYTFNSPAPPAISYAPEIHLEHDPVELLAIEESNVEQADSCCSETKSLVSSAWDALQEHYLASMVKVRNIPLNPLAQQLASMSIGTMAKLGLRTLQGLISGQQPASAAEALCLVHLVCALSLVVYEEEASHRVKSLYLQTLSYINGLPPSDQNTYHQLAALIWQPPDCSQQEINNFLTAFPSLVFDQKGKSPDVFGMCATLGATDALLTTARDFLDKLEITLLSGQDSSTPHDVQFFGLSNKHLEDSFPAGAVNEALTVTLKYTLQGLVREFIDVSGLSAQLEDIYQRLLNGSITSVRRVEIELLRAGQECLPTPRYYGTFVPSVRQACDQIYNRYDVGTSRRNDYHNLGIKAIESLISEFDSSSGDAVPELTTDELEAYLNDLNNPEPNGSTNSMMAGLETAGITSNDGNGAQQSRSTASSPSEGSERQATLAAAQQAEQQKLVEANAICEICGYRPKGDPQWFKGSMAKHKKLQHSNAPPRIYKCPFPGCTSQYKNRPDNLRQHQIEKSHFVKGEDITPKRPSKRKKVDRED